MGKITKLDDYRSSKHDRAVKRQKKQDILKRMNRFLSRADAFFEKANSEKGKSIVKEFKDVDE